MSSSVQRSEGQIYLEGVRSKEFRTSALKEGEAF